MPKPGNLYDLNTIIGARLGGYLKQRINADQARAAAGIAQRREDRL